jgi:hypothetical protein
VNCGIFPHLQNLPKRCANIVAFLNGDIVALAIAALSRSRHSSTVCYFWAVTPAALAIKHVCNFDYGEIEDSFELVARRNFAHSEVERARLWLGTADLPCFAHVLNAMA